MNAGFDGSLAGGFSTATEASPYVEYRLRTNSANNISEVWVWTRTDTSWQAFINVTITLTGVNGSSSKDCGPGATATAAGQLLKYNCSGGGVVNAQYVRMQRRAAGSGRLAFAEVLVMRTGGEGHVTCMTAHGTGTACMGQQGNVHGACRSAINDISCSS